MNAQRSVHGCFLSSALALWFSYLSVHVAFYKVGYVKAGLLNLQEVLGCLVSFLPLPCVPLLSLIVGFLPAPPSHLDFALFMLEGGLNPLPCL